MFGFLKKYSFDDIPLVSIDELKRKIRIVVIDDDKDSFPIESIQDYGFSIEYWDKLNSTRHKRLENQEFDIIILDIKGIIDKDLGDYDGLDILKSLKEKNREQIIIAFSGSKYDISKGEFWKKADGFMKKPIGTLEIKEELENIFEKYFTNNNLIKKLKSILEEETHSSNEYKKLENLISKSILNSSDFNLVEAVKLGITDTSKIVKIIKTLTDIYKKFQDE